MSVQPRGWSEVLERTAVVARAAFPKGTLAMWVRDELPDLFADGRFAAAFGVRGRPGISPRQLALVIVDAGYTSAGLMVGARREHGIALHGPLRVDNSAQTWIGEGYGRAAFSIDRDRRQVTCPQGVRSTFWVGMLGTRTELGRGPIPFGRLSHAQSVHNAHIRPGPAARSRLLYGEWLRRSRRRTDARTQLRAALEAFEQAGMAWTGHARAELRAAGESIAPTDDDPFATLTPQESQIVRLATTGTTKRRSPPNCSSAPKP